MRNGTEKRSGKTGAILCAAVAVLILGVYLAAVVGPLLGEAYGEMIAAVILAACGLLIVAVIVGVLAALRQRLREIEGGEEEDAKQY